MTAGMISVPVIVPLKAPGKINSGSRKWMITNNTLIEIHSNTSDCLLFYTLNGTKPDPFKKIGDKTTYRYTKAFTLKPGKRTVKAVAILKDLTKESSVNTKVFEVRQAEIVSENEEDIDDNTKTTWENQQLTDSEEEIENKLNDNRIFKKVLRTDEGTLKARKFNEMIRKVLTSSPDKLEDEGKDSPNLKYEEKPDAMTCPRCNAPRPSDPYARFCNGCSSILPPAPGLIRLSYHNNNIEQTPCKFCGSIIPKDSLRCGVCNKLNNTHNLTRRIQNGRINCKHCGSMNSLSVTECVVCDEPLDNIQKKAPSPSKDYMACESCSRINCSDARFCDWCGERLNSALMQINCTYCKSENPPKSEFCCNCGEKVKTPIRKTFQKTGRIDENTSTSTMELLSNLTRDSSTSDSTFPLRRLSKNISVQVGESLIETKEKVSRAVPTKLSPGKGYWRQQIDHIAQHLKIYAQNNVEFRDAISNHVISNLTRLQQESSRDNTELTFTATFALKGKPTKHTMKNNQVTSGETLIQALSLNINDKKQNKIDQSRPNSGRSRPSSARSVSSVKSTSRPNSARKMKKTYKKVKNDMLNSKLLKLSEENLMLLKIIKSSKTPNIDEFQDLLDSENTDPNTLDENDTPLLKLCVQNKRFDLLEPLLQSGAKVNQISGIKENAALHEAVLLGIKGMDAVDILLEADRVDLHVKDKKGNTAYDLAVEKGIDAISNKFTKHMSKDLLNDVMKV